MTMKIEIWSDVICPFCYIGKVKFETALNDFVNKNNIEVEWKSFQIMPDLETQESRSLDEVLAHEKGISLNQAKELNGYATSMAKAVGLDYHFDKAIPANTLKAHQFLHFAKKSGAQNEAEEILFKAYFSEGKNIDDTETLLHLAQSLGLDEVDLKNTLERNTFVGEINSDIKEASQIGVTGVPFFVFNKKYAVSGAQDSKVFLEVLQKSFTEWQSEKVSSDLEIIDGAVCKTDGTCE